MSSSKVQGTVKQQAIKKLRSLTPATRMAVLKRAKEIQQEVKASPKYNPKLSLRRQVREMQKLKKEH